MTDKKSERDYFGRQLTLTGPLVFKDKEEEKRWKWVGKFLKKAFKEVEKRLKEDGVNKTKSL